MSNYTGYHCPVCGKAFVQGDDVVVCPDCGAPHHRECYRRLGHCALEDKHASGAQWQPQEDRREPEEEPGAAGEPTLVCPRCGSHNPAGNIFCQVCGTQLTAGSAPGPDYGFGPDPRGNAQGQGYRPEGSGWEGYPGGGQPFGAYGPAPPDLGREVVQGISVREVCDYVGPNGWGFAMKFLALARSGGISVNWSAFFFSFFYCFYRKMYKLGWILLGVAAAAILPVFWFAFPFFREIWTQYGTLTVEGLTTLAATPAAQNFAMATSVFRTVMFFISVFCALFFNRAYFAEVCRNIRSMQKNGHYSSGSPDYNYALARKGGVSSSAVLLLICGVMVAYVGGCVALTFLLI